MNITDIHNISVISGPKAVRVPLQTGAESWARKRRFVPARFGALEGDSAL